MDFSLNKIKKITILVSAIHFALGAVVVYFGIEISKKQEKNPFEVLFIVFLLLIISLLPQIHKYIFLDYNLSLKKSIVSASSEFVGALTFLSISIYFVFLMLKRLHTTFFALAPKSTNNFIDFTYLVTPLLGVFCFFVARELYRKFQKILKNQFAATRSPQ